MSNIDAISLTEDIITNSDIDIMMEILDNGTDIAVAGSDINEIASLFDCVYDEMSNQNLVGCYLRSVGSETMLTPITAAVVYESGKELSEEECDAENSRLSMILTGKELDVSESIEVLSGVKADSEILGQLSKKELASLQASTPLGTSYKDSSTFCYFYKEGSANGTGTTYAYDGAESKSGYVKLGSIRVTGYLIKVKTVGTKTYDNIYSIVTASGLSNKFVKYYQYNMELMSSNASILDETWLDGGTKPTVSTSLASGFSSDGKSTITSSTSYSYNPNGQNILNALGNNNIKTWKATPASNVENGSWKISPSITVLNNSGTTSNTTVHMYVNSFQLSGGVRTYTSGSRVQANFTFRNHT